MLVGARDDDREAALRQYLLRFELLRFPVVADFDGATHIYRACRVVDITPRCMVDCMIAAVARRTGASILARDADMNHIAGAIYKERCANPESDV